MVFLLNLDYDTFFENEKHSPVIPAFFVRFYKSRTKFILV